MPSFNTALSALQANSTALDVVGNNLANLNTAGFKASNVSFSDLASQALAGAGDTPDGAGVTAPRAFRQFTQGGMNVTSGLLDAAIQGDGFFIVDDGKGNPMYTRAGDFRVDSAGNLITSSGEKVLGWTSSNGTLNASGPVGGITLPTGSLNSPIPSTEFTLAANLNANAVVAETADIFSTPIQVVDSLGAKHTLTVTFTKSDINVWDFTVSIPGEDLAAGTAGNPEVIASGGLAFDANGQLINPDAASGPVVVSVAGLANGAADVDLNWNLFSAAGQPLLTQFATPSGISAADTDGRASASLSKVSIEDGGRIVGLFSDGTQQTVAQLAVAFFRNPETMRSAGNNYLVRTEETADPAVGVAGTGGRGSILGGALESSNADMAREFTNLIVYQRGYQANSRVITTMSELAQETINLIR